MSDALHELLSNRPEETAASRAANNLRSPPLSRRKSPPLKLPPYMAPTIFHEVANGEHGDLSSGQFTCTADLKLIKSRLAVQRYMRLLQLCLYCAIAALALMVCVTMTVTFRELGEQCPLYAAPGPNVDMSLGQNGSHSIHVDGVEFGSTKTCYYTLYLNATTAAYSLMWGILFAVITSEKYSKKGYLRKTIFPSLLFNAVIFTSEVISSCVLTLGFTHWCKKLVEIVHIPKKIQNTAGKLFTCSVLQSLRWQTTSEMVGQFRGPRMFVLLTFAQLASWLLTLCTLILTLICAERFFKSIWHGELDSYSSDGSQINIRQRNNGIYNQQSSSLPPSAYYQAYNQRLINPSNTVGGCSPGHISGQLDPYQTMMSSSSANRQTPPTLSIIKGQKTNDGNNSSQRNTPRTRLSNNHQSSSSAGSITTGSEDAGGDPLAYSSPLQQISSWTRGTSSLPSSPHDSTDRVPQNMHRRAQGSSRSEVKILDDLGENMELISTV